MIIKAQHILSDVLTNVMKIIMDNNEKDNHMVRSTNGWTNGWLVVPKKWNMYYSRWRHQMETSSALLPLCAGNSQITGDPPLPPHTHTQRPVTRSFDVFFDMRLNKRLSKQGWWVETLPLSLWCHCNGRKSPAETNSFQLIRLTDWWMCCQSIRT